MQSPLGTLTLEVASVDGEPALVGLWFGERGEPGGGTSREATQLDEVEAQLGAYFAGERHDFDVPVRLAGTAFRQRVWAELVRIPFGETISYGELARRVGDANASRAVGAANGANPVSIIVPCHRVVNSKGELHGYGGGLERKRWLLEHERARVGLFASAGG